MSMPSLMAGCSRQETPGPAGAGTTDEARRFTLMTLDPGHFHAALVQKSMYPDVSPTVHVYAPDGPELQQHLTRIESYNGRADDPTRWETVLHTSADYLDRMLEDRPGNIVVIAGNNARKAEYIERSVEGGLHVLADKPMARTPDDVVRLRGAFTTARRRGTLLYDIMTERFEITNRLQRELSRVPALFGELEKGTPDNPAITKESVHHFSKLVSGAPLVRPAWFFDVEQQGEGIVDVTTHLVDLVQWAAFPDQEVQPTDVSILQASRSATTITPEQFTKVTGLGTFPDYLQGAVRNGALEVYSNGAFTYTLRGVHARVSVVWNYEAPAGTGDTHYSAMHGTRASLVIRQGAEQKFAPVLYVERHASVPAAEHAAALQAAIASLQDRFPGIEARADGEHSVIAVPAHYAVGHEAHFAQVTENFLRYVREGAMPEWEVPNMITKYATIMQAYEKSRQA